MIIKWPLRHLALTRCPLCCLWSFCSRQNWKIWPSSWDHEWPFNPLKCLPQDTGMNHYLLTGQLLCVVVAVFYGACLTTKWRTKHINEMALARHNCSIKCFSSPFRTDFVLPDQLKFNLAGPNDWHQSFQKHTKMRQTIKFDKFTHPQPPDAEQEKADLPEN